MARATHPRSDRHHEVAASHVLARHAMATGKPVALPVPIEQIIESTYGIEILWNELDEPPGTTILGALYPQAKRIVINERHAHLFESVIGPERFTLAHELSHWIYDAVLEGQLALDVDEPSIEQHCYHRQSPGLSDTLRLREINANKLAAHLLLPAALLRAVDIDGVLADLRGTAARWGVSQQTLRIRLESLGLVSDSDLAGLDLGWTS